MDIVQIAGMTMIVFGIMALKVQNPIKIGQGAGEELKLPAASRRESSVKSIIFLSSLSNPAESSWECVR